MNLATCKKDDIAKHVSEKGLISKMDKQVIQLNNKTQITQCKTDIVDTLFLDSYQ